MPKLQEFREQYPQYDHLSDDELADALHRRYYSEMPVEQYRQALGLKPLPKPPPPPTIWDRVTSIFDDEENKPANIMAAEQPRFNENFGLEYEGIEDTTFEPPATEEPESTVKRAKLSHQFFAGIDEWSAGKAHAEAFDAAFSYRDAEKEAKGEIDPRPTGGVLGYSGQMISNQVRAIKADAGDEDARRQIVKDVERNRANLVEIMQSALDRRRELQDRAATVPYSQDTREMMEAETWGETLSELSDDPIMIVAETAIRSLPNMTEGALIATGGALLAGPPGFAAGMGAGAGMVEYRNSFADYLEKAGVDQNSAEALVTATMNNDLMRAAHEYALKRSSIIGSVSAISGGVATKPLTPFIQNTVGREFGNIAAQAIVQAGLEGAGEAGAQLWAEGEIRPGEVAAEMTGSLIEAPIEVGAATVSGARAANAKRRAARVESEVNEILGRGSAEQDVPHETSDDVVNYADQRLKRRQFRDALLDRVDLLTPEDIEVVSWENLTPISKKQFQNAVDKAVRGKELGVGETRIIQSMLDEITENRLAGVDLAKEKLASARQRRAESRSQAEGAQAVAEDANAGERYAEAEYAPEMTAESRMIFEKMEQAHAAGVRQEQIEQAAMAYGDDSQGLMNAIEEIIDEQQRTRRAAPVPQQPPAEPAAATEAAETTTAYTDELTGLGNLAAYETEIRDYPAVADIGIDHQRWISDNLGGDAAEAVQVAVGEALDQFDVTAYRTGDGSFTLAGTTERQVQAAVELARGVLAAQEVASPRGKLFGIEITEGIGSHPLAAKAKRKANAGHKGARPPKNAVLSSRAGKVLDMEPGTNYVPMIGQTGALPINANHELILQSTGKPVRIPKTPVRREHILALMQRYFGKRIYQGRVRGKLRLGYYRPGHGEIRIKNANDIEVAVHEVAHWLDDRYPWISDLYKKFSDEVKSVSYDAGKATEGWAEFMRLYLTQEYEAIKRAPSFYDAFNKELSKNKKLRDAVIDIQEACHAWTQQGVRARHASKHGSDITVMDRMRRYFSVNIFQSALNGLRSIGENGAIQADLADNEAAELQIGYEKLRLAVGGSNGVLEAAVFYGTPGWRADGQGIELTGEGLLDIFGGYWGSEDLALYMMARRGQELAGQGRENLQRLDEIADGLRRGEENQEFSGIFDRYQQFNERMLDFAEGGGILNADTRRMIEEMNKNYVPFHRVIDSFVDGKDVKQGGNPFMRLKGGTQNVANIFDNIINNTGHIIRASMINDGKRQVLRVFERGSKMGAAEQSLNAGKYAAPIPKEARPVRIAREDILRKVVESLGITWSEYRLAKETGMASEETLAIVQMADNMAAGMNDFVDFFRFEDPKGRNVDFYMDNGEKHFFEINEPNLLDSLQFLGPRGTNWLIGTAGAFSATLRRGVVAVPVFQVKNFIRDTTNAWLLSSHVKVPAVRATRVIASRMRKDPAYIDMMLNGGGFANRSQGLQTQRRVIINPLRLADTYDRFMGRFENANRLAEYKAAVEAGEAPRRAALLSREISTDFSMRGSSEIVRYLAIAVPFLNARVQGLYRVKRQFNRRETAVSYAVRGLALAGATMALYALNKDDDRYKELPEDIKDLYWVFFTGPGEDDYFLLPKPFESGMLFGTLPERMYEFAEQENGKEFADALGWMMLETFNMDMTPQVFQPWLDLQRNKNFTGAHIIPFYLENVEPTEQFTFYTSETVREAAQAMGISPIKMEHVIRGYTGTLGTYSLAASDAMIRAATEPEDRLFGADPSRGETWKENIIVKALIDPLVNEGPPRRTKYVTDLYDMIREAEKTANTVALHQRRSIERLESYLNDPQTATEYAASDMLEDVRAALNEIRKNIDLVRMDKDMTADEKRVEIWNLTRERNKFSRQAAIEIRKAQEKQIRKLNVGG